MTLSAWFGANAEALAFTQAQIQAGVGSRKIVQALCERFACPFTDRTALQRYAKKHLEGDWASRAGNKNGHSAAPPKPTKPKAPTFIRSSDDVRSLERCENFIVTAAVNNCDANEGFTRACERWAADRNGQFIVKRVRYRNPKTPDDTEELREREWWSERFLDYYVDNELRPHERLSIMETKVQATASNPLPARLGGRTQNRSAIFAHPQLAMRTLPTPQHKLPKTLYTTGAVTLPEYSDSLSGDLAQFHHTHAAVLVEVRGDRFHLREVTWDGETFIDIDQRWSGAGGTKAPRPLAWVKGDIHDPIQDPDVMRASFDGPDSVWSVCKPRTLVLHDVTDGKPFNPHEWGKRLSAAMRVIAGNSSALASFVSLSRWLNSLPADLDVVIDRSNHDDFLLRWLERGKPEPENAKLYHKLCFQMLDIFEKTGVEANPLTLALDELLDRPIRWLNHDESFRLGGVELGMHGHLGPNGARGNPQNMSQIGTRFIAAHIHSPWIWQGGYWAGLNAQMRHGYNKGPSSWLHTDVLLHDNGFRQMLHYIKGHYRG